MGISRLHKLAAVKLDPDSYSGTPVIIGGTRRQNVRTGTDVRQEVTSGMQYAQFQSVYAGAPMIDFSTVSLGRALTAIGAFGLAITATSAGTGLTAFGTKRQEGGGIATGTNHISMNTKEGLLIPTDLSVNHQGDFELGLQGLVTWDGTNAPIVESNAADLPTPLDDQRYSIGAIYLGTTVGDQITLGQIVDVRFGFGINAQADGSDSDVFPTFASIYDVAQPHIEITTLDMTLGPMSNGVPLEGKDLSSAKTAIFLRKRARVQTSGFVANGTAQHIKCVPLAGCAYRTEVGAYQGSSNGACKIRIPLYSSDGSTAPWAWTVGAAIAAP